MAPRTPKDPARTPAKGKAAPKPAAGPKPRAARPSPPPPAEAPVEAVTTLRLKDLVDSVAAATGARKPEVKKSVEATLSALGTALALGNVLVLPPLGKLRVVKTTATAVTLKLRPVGAVSAGKGAALALADDAEGG